MITPNIGARESPIDIADTRPATAASTYVIATPAIAATRARAPGSVGNGHATSTASSSMGALVSTALGCAAAGSSTRADTLRRGIFARCFATAASIVGASMFPDTTSTALLGP